MNAQTRHVRYQECTYPSPYKAIQISELKDVHLNAPWRLSTEINDTGTHRRRSAEFFIKWPVSVA